MIPDIIDNHPTLQITPGGNTSIIFFADKKIAFLRSNWHPTFKCFILIIFQCLFFLKVTAQSPVISSFSPTSGPIGTTVIITGTNFSPVAANNIVYFGAVKAAVSAASTTSLAVTVPGGTTYQPITVTANNLTAYSNKPFVVTFPANNSGFSTNSFVPKADFTTGSNPQSVATGDLDGDGKADMAIVNAASNTVSVLRNTSTSGTISFAAKVDYATGLRPQGIAIGDVDGDGKLDLLAVTTISTVSVFRNTSTSGTISFAAKVDYTTGSSPYSIAIGDMDGDGKPDLAIANYGSSTVSLFRNTSTSGTVSFAAKVDYATGNNPQSVSIGDLDGDGKADMAVANYNSNTVSVFRNSSTSGVISFAAKVDYTTGSTPQSVSIGDLDGDGKADMAVANYYSNTISVFRNTSVSGTASFAAKADYTTGNNPQNISIADLNGDGKPELAVVNYGLNAVSVLRNTGTSGAISFAAKIDYATGSNPYSVAIGDLDGDGKADMAVANYGSNTVSVLRNQADAPSITSFTPTNGGIGSTITITGINFTGTTAVSLGGVAATSFTIVSDAVITAVVAAIASGSVVVTTPKGTATIGGFYNGTFLPVISSFSPASGPIGTTVTINSNNFSPVAANNIVYFGAVKAAVSAASTNSLTVTVPAGTTYQPITVTTNNLTTYTNKPFIPTFPTNNAGFTANSFAAKGDYPTDLYPQGVAVGDLDGDGKVDIVVANYYLNTVSVYRNTSTGGGVSFAARVDYTTGILPRSVAIADIDGDGKLDLAVANYSSNTISVLRNTGVSGTVSFAAKADYATGSNPQSVATGDVDGDGRPDLAVANYVSNTVSILRNTSTSGTVSFAAKLDYATGSGPQSVAIGDVDGDGKPDLAVASNTVSVLRNTSTNGVVSFVTKADYPTGSGPQSVAIGDLDGDGKVDMAVANIYDNTISVFRSTSTSGVVSFAAKVDYATGSSPYNISITDLNGDGKADLAVANSGSNTVSVFRNMSTSGTVALAAKADYPTGVNPRSVAIGDLDGDGKPDLAIANYGSNTVYVLRNQVDAPNITSFTPTNAGIGTTVTITGSNFTGTTAVSLGGVAATSFTIVSDAVITAMVAAVASGDVAVTTPKGTATMGGFYNGAVVPVISSFSPASGPIGTTVTITGTNFSPVAANNIVYFGAVKAAVSAASNTSLTVTVPVGATYQSITITTNNLTAYANKSFLVTFPSNSVGFTDASFTAKIDYTAGSGSQSVAIGDLDGDGKADMAVANYYAGTISLFRNTGVSGTVSFAAKVDYATGSGPQTITIGDMDGDGKPDLAVAYANNSNTVSIYRNTSTSGTISFAAKVDYATGNTPYNVAIGDLDGDGKPDLAVANYGSGGISVLRNTGTIGTISFAAKLDYATGGNPQSVFMGDVDGDGKLDVAVGNSNSNSVSILRNTGTTGLIAFAAKVDYASLGYFYSFSLGDVDGDGKPDLAVAGYYDNIVSILRNTSTTGTVSFTAKVDFATESHPYSVSIGDLDGDGKPDLVVANASSTTVSVFKNIGTSGTISFAAKVNYTTGTDPRSISIGDMDGDGKPDIAVANNSSSTVSVCRNLIITTTIPTLATGNTINTNLCAGNPVDVPFTASSALDAGNVFTAQLSDSSGSFTSPVNIGTLTGFTSDTIHAIIPSATLAGANYHIRVISSSPAITSLPNTSPIMISRPPSLNFTITGNSNVCPGTQTYSASVAEPNVIWKWQVSGGGTVNASGAAAIINWITPGNYTITLSDSNSCGNGPVRTLNVTVGAAAPTVAPVLAATGRTLKSSPLTGAATGYRWYKNGTLITGVTDSTYYAQVAGIYTVKFFNTCGEGPASNSIEFINDAGVQTISFPAIPSTTYGDAAFRLTATASSGLPVTYRVISGPVSIIGDTVFINGAGTALIEATQPGNLNYQAAPAVTQSFTINKAVATVVLSNLNRVYDGSAKIPNAVTNPAGLQVTYLFNGTLAQAVNAGTYYVAAAINSNNYSGAASDTLRIAKANQQITLTLIPDKEYGTTPFNVQAGSSSGLAVILSISTSPVNCATLSGNTITINNTGTVIINASQPGNANYNAATDISDTFNITKANQQITIAPIPEISIDSSFVTVNATVSTGLPLSYSIVTNPPAGVASLSGNVISLPGDTGTVVVKVSQAGNQFYNAAEAQRTFNVLGRSQFITFSPIPNKTFGDAPFDLNATASSALPVQFSIVSGAAFLSGNVLTISGAGIIIVEARQPGNSSFRAAIPVRQSFTVGQAAQTLTIDTIVNKTYGDASFAITAQASSGLPVNFTILSGYAYLSGNNIVITGAGMVVVKAVQNGNQNYLPATAQRTFCVVPKKPQKIYGFTQSCISTQQYAIDTIAGATYTWTVPGGGTLLTNSGSKINVSWNNTGTHQLFVKANNGCNPATNDTIGLTVQVINLPVPPEVTNLFPVNGTVVTDFPVSLSWQASGISQVYDLYIWPEGSTQPASPFAANLQAVAAVIYNGSQLPGFAPGVRYNWKVITKNACKQSNGVTAYFIISKLPNLVLQSVQAADTVFSGKAIDITVNVLNNGGASTRNTHWTDAVYLSRDTILDTRFDAYIAGAGNLSSLDSGMQYINTLHGTLPQNIIGNYHLIVVTNAYNSLTEVTRFDDTIVRPILINLTPPPDLQVTVVATPADAFSAQFIPVTYTVKNKGTGTTSSSRWMDYIYISPDPVFNRTTAVKIGEKEQYSIYNPLHLLPDSAYTNTVSVLLPARFFGTYYIFVETDVKDSVYEFTFENNNTNRNDSIQIFLTPPPDFVVTQSNIPASISSEEIVTINYQVKNMGATAPPVPDRKWMDGIYISKDSVFNISKARLLDYTIPYTRFVPNFCHIGTTYSGGGGGGAVGPGPIGFNPLDTTSYPMPKPGPPGSNIQNYCNAQSFNVKYYTGTDITSNNDTLYHIGYGYCLEPGRSYHPFMVPDESYQGLITAILPDSLEGTYYLHVRTDFTNTVFEFQQENNNTKWSKVQILNPDLVVNRITIADTANSGTNVPLSWMVKNGGHGKVFDKNRKDLIWLSASPVYNPANMIRLDSLVYCTAMDTGATVTQQKTIRIPDGLSGNYYLFVETDKDKAIYEGNHETNNYLSKLVTINLSPWPDLKVNTVQLSKDSVEFDEDFMLSYNVSNIGIAAIAGKTWKDYIYISGSPVLDVAHAYKAAEVFRSQSLDTNASYTVNQPMHVDGAINASGAASHYYVHVFTDGNNDLYEHNAENNNIKASNSLFAKYLDLAVTTVGGSLNVFSGQNASVSWQVMNKGGKSDAYSTIWYDKVYLSADTVLDAGDADIYVTPYITGPILSNGTYTRTINYQVPNGISGNYYLLVKTDYYNSTRDINRNNNVNTIRYPDGTPKTILVTLTPSPDLVVTALDVPSIGYTGQPITIKWQVKNGGIGPTLTGGWKEKIYLTTTPNPYHNGIIDGTLIGTYTRFGNLAVDSSYADSLRVFVPAILNGNYYLYFATDFPSQVYEHNAEDNNGASKQIFIIRPQPSDLVVSTITKPLQALAGDTFTVSWKVKNMGINPAEGYFTQGVYLSEDSAWSVDDALVSNTEATIYISPSDEKLFSKNIRTTGARDGSYFVIVRTDLTNNIVETDDNNNTGISTDSITVSVLNLPLNTVIPHPLLSKTELYYKLVIPDSLEGETVLISLRSYLPVTPNELYIKFGDIPSRSTFDYGYQSANNGNQDIVIPAASKGTYYILVYNNADANQYNISLLAQRISFSVISVHTNEGGNTGLVTVKIGGAKFEPGMQVSLQSNTLGTIVANSMQYVNSTTVFATFNLGGRTIGLYNVVAKKMNDNMASLPDGFRILQGSGGGFQGGGTTTGGFYCTIRNIGVDELVDFDIQNPAQVRLGQYFSMNINFGNSGNVDVPLPGRLMISMSGAPISLTQEGLAEGKTELYLEFKELNGPEGILRPGATGSITIYTRGTFVGSQAYRLIE